MKSAGKEEVIEKLWKPTNVPKLAQELADVAAKGQSKNSSMRADLPTSVPRCSDGRIVLRIVVHPRTTADDICDVLRRGRRSQRCEGEGGSDHTERVATWLN